MSKSKDRLYSDTRELVESFRFDQSVASVFEDMISRSVPGYQQILTLLPTLVRYNKTQGNFYDLGCSLGAGMLAMAEGVEGPNKQTIIGVDNSAAMLANARPALDSYAANKAINFDLIEADLVEQEINLAAMVLMNFTLQFIATEQRDQVIKNIYDGWVFVNPDGSFSSTVPVAGEAASVSLPNPAVVIPGGSRRTASYHTHAAFDPRFDNENFSPTDLNLDRQEGVDGYLATPGGQFKKHIIATDQVVTLGTIAN